MAEQGNVPNSAEDGHAEGESPPAVRDRDQVDLRGWKAWYLDVLVYVLPLAVSICAFAFAVVSVTASWKALGVANKANDWAYWSYNSSLVQIRLSLIQLCIDSPDIDAETCQRVSTWDYPRSVYNIYHPDGS